MKRSHSPDTYDHQQTNNYRGGHRGGHHNQHSFNKRHRGDGFPPQPLTIEDRIARIGETGFRNVDIGSLAKDIDIDLAVRGGEEEKIKTIISQICKCIVSFPTRVATYSTLVSLISAKHYQVSRQVIDILHASYTLYLQAQKWQEALTIMHFLSHLVNCKVTLPSALLAQFELLLEVTLEDNIPQVRSDYYVYTVLSSLPLVAFELFTHNQELFEQILSTIESYLSKRSKDHLNTTRVWLSDDSTIQMDYLDSLWVQTKNFKANNWSETFIHRPYNEKEYKDIALTLIAQDSPKSQIPPHSPDYVYPAPRIVFRIFEDDVTEANQLIHGSDKIERFCIENHIRNIIDEIPDERMTCSRHLSHMHLNEQLPMKHILIETILGEIFTLPNPKHPQVCYQALLYELSKVYNPASTAENMKSNYDVVMNGAVKILFENLDTMNITCLSRFVEWFSFHLNNTNFVFPWQSWKDATFKDKESPKAVFVREVLERCVRFTFHKKIDSLVNPVLSSLMPDEPQAKCMPVFADNPKFEELAGLVTKLITQKQDLPTIAEALNIQIAGVKMPDDHILREEKHFDKLLKIDVFVSVILNLVANKSLTHLTTAFGKYMNVMRALVGVENGQIQLLETIGSCLGTHTHTMTILVDKLTKAELVQAKTVCTWIFSDKMKADHLKPFLWEILNNAVYRSSLVLERLNKSKEDMNVTQVKTEKLDEEEKADGSDVEMRPVDAKGELDAKIEKADAAYQELIFHIFEMFSNILGSHIKECETASKSYMDNWFRWIVGRMQQVYNKQYSQMQKHYDKIKSIIDGTPSIGNAITNLNQ